MNNRHIVDTAVFDIGFSSEETAFEFQTELNAFINNELLAVVEEVFDKSSAANAVIRIQSLEIDLGDVSLSRYQDELPRRLRDKLTQQLGEIRQSIRDKSASNNALIDVQSASGELVEYFLLHGHLPWHSSLAAGQSIEQLLNKMIATEPHRLKQFLMTSAQKGKLIERLVNQFNPGTVVHVCQLLAPGQSRRIKGLFDELMRHWPDLQPLFAIPQSGAEAMSRQLWSGLIMLLLEKGSRQLSVEEMIVMVLQGLFANADDSKQATLLTLSKKMAMSGQSATTALVVILRQLVDELSIDVSATENVDALETERDQVVGTDNKTAEVQLLQQRLIDALITGKGSYLEDYWSSLLNQHAGLLEQLLQQYGQRAGVREKIAHGFSEAMLLDILSIFEPIEHSFVKAVLDQSDLFLVQADDQTQTKSQLRQNMWQLTLGFLLVERGSRFNKKSYIGSLLRQMAMSTGETYEALLVGLSKNLAALPDSNGLSRQLLDFLTELRHEVRPFPKQPSVQANSDQHNYQQYELLSRVLKNEIDKTKVVDLVKAVQELKEKAPWLLLRLLKEIQLGHFGQPLRAYNLPTALLRQLALVTIDLSKPVASSAASDLVDAIDRYSERAGNVALYFSHVIFCLLNAQLLDFDAILSESNVSSNKPDSAKALDKVISTPLKLQTNVPILADCEQMVGQFLEGKDKQASEANGLVSAFQQLVLKRPALLRQLLLSSIRDQKTVARMSELLPESLLVQLLSSMGLARFAELKQCAEIIVTACYVKEFGLAMDQLRSLKWQAIFSYIAENGGLYSQKGFVQYLVAWLCEAGRPTDTDTLSAVISRQLSVNSQPATQPLAKQIVQWIDAGAAAKITETSKRPNTVIDAVSESDDAAVEEVYIANAGLVLAAPYLPRLFDMLGLVQQSAFKNRDAAMRGVHMLQFLVNGSITSPEFQLVLNKLICGVSTGVPIEREISLSDAETSQLEGLLQGMIQNWKGLGNTSIAGLRESFLQRQGRLQLKNDAWHLLVEPKSFDMLLDQLPWSYSTIKYPWMERVIYVEWR